MMWTVFIGNKSANSAHHLLIEVRVPSLPTIIMKLTYLRIVWKHIHPILEPKVLLKKQEHLEEEMKPIRSACRTIVHTSYQEYKKTLMPSQWKYLP